MNRYSRSGSSARAKRGQPARATGSARSQLPKKSSAAKGSAAKNAAKKSSLQKADHAQPAEPLPPLTLGFVRGVAPSKWAERWARAATNQPLELLPVDLHEVDAAREAADVLIERVAPGTKPVGAPGSTALSASANMHDRHAVLLYEESVALVVAADHELAEQREIGLDEVGLVSLLSHPDHQTGWPAPQPWADASWAPVDAVAALELVATGMGGVLLSQPLATHLSKKRAHAVIPVTRDGESLLAGTEIWATWAVSRDAADVQHLVGVLRGRTARSSRA